MTITENASALGDLNHGGDNPSEADRLLGNVMPVAPPGQAPSRPHLASLAEQQHLLHQEQLLALKREDHEADLTLKKKIGNYAVGAVVGQLVAANLAFGVYLGWMQWQAQLPVPAEVIIAWLSTTVVEVVGIVLVVTKYLFPDGGNDWNREHPQ